MEYDIPTYPELGNVYLGDYYESIPYEDYIYKNDYKSYGMQIYDIRDYGAVPDDGRLNTEAINKTIEESKIAGGGVILIDGGTYLSGTIQLYSNMILHIASGSVLQASRNAEKMNKSFIIAQNSANITITGGGTICGNGEWYVYEPRKKPLLKPLDISALPPRDAIDINGVPDTMRYHYRQRIRYAEDKYDEGLPPLKRPDYMVWIKECQNVMIRNIVLEASMSWTLNFDCSRDIIVSHTIINNNRHVANTDGIDITGSSNVMILKCFIATADDGIVLKNPNHTQREMTNIRINDCRIQTVMNAFKIGTETKYDISDVVVENCHFELPDIYPGSVSGISIESADGSYVRNVSVSNITMDNITCPLFIALNMRNRDGIEYPDRFPRPYGGGIENIHIENIQAKNAEAPSLISGFLISNNTKKVYQPIKSVAIKNFHVTYRDNDEKVQVPETIEEYLEEYPENNNFGDVDACGLWARHCEEIKLENIEIIPRKVNTRDNIRIIRQLQ